MDRARASLTYDPSPGAVAAPWTVNSYGVVLTRTSRVEVATRLVEDICCGRAASVTPISERVW